jgi:hypothetical protein
VSSAGQTCEQWRREEGSVSSAFVQGEEGIESAALAREAERGEGIEECRAGEGRPEWGGHGEQIANMEARTESARSARDRRSTRSGTELNGQENHGPDRIRKVQRQFDTDCSRLPNMTQIPRHGAGFRSYDDCYAANTHLYGSVIVRHIMRFM